MPGPAKEERSDPAAASRVVENSGAYSWEASAGALADRHQPLIEANLPQVGVLSNVVAGRIQSPTERIALAENHIEVGGLRRMAKLISGQEVVELDKKIESACAGISGFNLREAICPTLEFLSIVGGIFCALGGYGTTGNSAAVFFGLAPAALIFGICRIVRFFSWDARVTAARNDVLSETDENVGKAHTIWKEIKEQADYRAASKKYTSAERSELFLAMLAARADEMLEQAQKLEGNLSISITAASDTRG